MVKHLLQTSEIRELADKALGTQLDLVHSPAAGLASGAIVPIALAPGIMLLHGSMRGLRAISAVTESQPGLSIEIRLQGRSRTASAEAPELSFELEPGQTLIHGGSCTERWYVDIPAQPRFDTVSIIFSTPALEVLAPIAPELTSRLSAWMTNNETRNMPATPLMICLAERALAMHPYDTNAPLKGYALAMELLAEIQAVALEDRANRAANDMDIGLVQQARAFINRHPTVALGPDDLAGHCFVSTSRLKTAFRNASDQTIASTIRSAALSEAKRLLLGGVNVSHVASLVGYRRPEAFSKAFRKETGLSPRALVKAAYAEQY